MMHRLRKLLVEKWQKWRRDLRRIDYTVDLHSFIFIQTKRIKWLFFGNNLSLSSTAWNFGNSRSSGFRLLHSLINAIPTLRRASKEDGEVSKTHQFSLVIAESVLNSVTEPVFESFEPAVTQMHHFLFYWYGLKVVLSTSKVSVVGVHSSERFIWMFCKSLVLMKNFLSTLE